MQAKIFQSFILYLSKRDQIEQTEDAVFDDHDKINILPEEMDHVSKRQLNRLRPNLTPNKHKITYFEIVDAQEEAKYLKTQVVKQKKKMEKKSLKAKKKIKGAKIKREYLKIWAVLDPKKLH